MQNLQLQLDYRFLFRVGIFILGLCFLLSGKVAAYTSEWTSPTQFAGLHYGSAQWSNITNLGTPDNNAYTTVNATFGNPAPQIHYYSFGFANTFGDILNNTISKVELKISARARYSVSPQETITAYIVNPDGDVVSALNATSSVYYQSPLTQSFTVYNFYWQNGTNDSRVSDYFGAFNPETFTIVLGVQKNDVSGSTNFVDIGYFQLRFTTSSNAITDAIANPSKTWLATQNLQQLLLTKAPFAYVAPVFSLQLNQQSDQGLSINFPVVRVGHETQYYSATLAGQESAFTTIKTIIGYSMTGAFVFYLISLMNRVMSGGGEA